MTSLRTALLGHFVLVSHAVSAFLFYKGPPTFWQSSIVSGLSVCPSVRGRSNLVIFNRISSKFYIWMASIKLSLKYAFEYGLEYRLCPTNDNQDGRQNGPLLPISAVVVTLI